MKNFVLVALVVALTAFGIYSMTVKKEDKKDTPSVTITDKKQTSFTYSEALKEGYTHSQIIEAATSQVPNSWVNASVGKDEYFLPVKEGKDFLNTFPEATINDTLRNERGTPIYKKITLK